MPQTHGSEFGRLCILLGPMSGITRTAAAFRPVRAKTFKQLSNIEVFVFDNLVACYDEAGSMKRSVDVILQSTEPDLLPAHTRVARTRPRTAS